MYQKIQEKGGETMTSDMISIMWVVLIILFTLVEAITLGLTSIWFAVGALGALLASALGFGFEIQIIIFVLVSAVMMIYTRPIIKDVLKVGHNKTNIDSLIGAFGYVTKVIQPGETGQVKVNGQIWTAKGTSDDTWIELNERIEVVAIEGVKLIVRRVETESIQSA
jgi:membrane protein implicated in regulation of membrane protease activity